MAITKDEASDLQSHVNRLLETKRLLMIASDAYDVACRNYQTFVHGLQYPPKKATE